MKSILSLCLLFSLNLNAANKRLMAAMHGKKMSVVYFALNSGKHILIVKEKVGMQKNKTIFRERSIIDLKLEKDEYLANHKSFRCWSDDKKYAYAVINKKSVNSYDKSSPVRAWLVNEQALVLSEVHNVKSIKCQWFQEGESQFPF